MKIKFRIKPLWLLRRITQRDTIKKIPSTLANHIPRFQHTGTCGDNVIKYNTVYISRLIEKIFRIFAPKIFRFSSVFHRILCFQFPINWSKDFSKSIQDNGGMRIGRV